MLFWQFIQIFNPKLKKFIAARRLWKTHETIKRCVKNNVDIICHSKNQWLNIRWYIDYMKEINYIKFPYDIKIATVSDIKKWNKGKYFIDEISLFNIEDIIYLLDTVEIVWYNGTLPEFSIKHFKKRSEEDIKRLKINTDF